jgi:RimJ/RimL family protein N-acetyltransferase
MDANTVEPFDEQFFAASGWWLTNSELRRLILAPEPDEAARRAWFETLPERHDYWIWGVCHNHKPIGCFGLKHIDLGHGKAEYWGYIGIPEFWGKGIGKWMLDQAITRAELAGLHALHLQVLADNERAVRLYHRCGFVEVARDNQLLTMQYRAKSTDDAAGR